MPFNQDTGLYEFEDIAFVNTSELTEAARHYKKHGCYTFAPEGSKDYNDFWDREEDRRRNGMVIPGKLITRTGPDGKKYQEIQQVHITGKHYGFLNYGRIKMTKDKDDNDDENEGQDVKSLTWLTGNRPKNARKVGKKSIDFPRFIDGQYHYFVAKKVATEMGLNMVAAKARRKGFSYIEGFDCADEINMNPDVLCLVVAYDTKYLTKGNQILPMSKRYLDWFEKETDFNRGFLKEEIDYIKLGFKPQGQGHMEEGYMSELIGLSLMNNPDAPAGKDAVIIKFEESGKNPLLKESLDITMSTTEEGSTVTGRIDIFGTGGTKEANWQDFKEIFYEPDQYNCMIFDNIWDEGCRGTGCGFFYPQQVGDTAFMDQNGNSLQELSLKALEVRKIAAKKSQTQSNYVRWIGQRATCPNEAFASGSDNIFPSAEIIEQINKVEHDGRYRNLARYGELVRTTEGNIRFKLNEVLKNEGIKVHDPIFNYPLKKDQDAHGCYVEWFSPYRDMLTGTIPAKLYRIWHDPYAFDKDKKDIVIKDSLGAAYVYEVTNGLTAGKGDYLCACLVGRPETTDKYNENLLKLAQYWNAQVMFENDRGDVKGYFARRKMLHYLADEPELKWVEELRGKTNRQKGINMTPKRKGHGAMFLRDWLIESRGADAFGVERLNLHYIYDTGLLRELLKWNMKGNFDRVSAMLVGMFDMKECFEVQIKTPKKETRKAFFKHNLFQ